MSTRSTIAVKTDSGFTAIYCHFDGYLDGVGAMLKEHYNTAALAAELVSLGDISSLGEVIGEMYPYFDRYDVILAHLILEYDYNVSGVLQERPSNKRRKMSTGYQVHRMIPNFTQRDLYPEFFANDNAKAIYHELVKRYNLPVGDFDKRYQVGD